MQCFLFSSISYGEIEIDFEHFQSQSNFKTILAMKTVVCKRCSGTGFPISGGRRQGCVLAAADYSRILGVDRKEGKLRQCGLCHQRTDYLHNEPHAYISS